MRTTSIKVCMLLCLPMLFACNSEKESPQKEASIRYSFFVAGHTYGKPSVNNIGMHPPFVAKFDKLKSSNSMDFGVLTGDIVIWSNDKEWEEVDVQIDSLGLPVYFAPGNHDVSNRKVYESRYGSPTYQAFVHQSDLFVLLDPNLDQWNISGEQLTFLQETLAEHGNQVNNVFIFFHQVLWWDANNRFGKLKLNSKQGRAEEINFWTEIEPLLKELATPVYLFAGDVGAFPNGSEYMYEQYDNFTLIASGMGGGQRDNMIWVDVDESGGAMLRLIALNGDDENALGNLEDYRLPE